MSETKSARPPAAARRSRTLLVSFLGAVVRPMGNWMPIAGTVELLAQSGLDASSVRTAVFRLKKRGWLESQTRSGLRGYALTPAALEALAAGDEVIWHARQPADLGDGWCLVNFSVPESARAKRHQLTAHLTSLGFGNIGSAVWIAPARMLPAAQRAIAELDLTEQCAVFVGDYLGGNSSRPWSATAGTSPRSTGATASSSRTTRESATASRPTPSPTASTPSSPTSR
ncbi:hypothetical protein ACFQ0T_34820 [Kitasatospora gansuensis]